MTDINLDDIDALVNSVLTELDTQAPKPKEPEQHSPPDDDVNSVLTELADEAGPEAEPVATEETDELGTIIAQATGQEEEKSADQITTDVTPALQLPTFSASELVKTIDIRNYATLVDLTTARWHGKVKDHAAAKRAADSIGASAGAFEAKKHLLAGADEKLERIRKAIDKARAKYYELTLPWSTTGISDRGRRSGSRLLPNTLFMDFTAEMASAVKEMQEAVEEFVPEYPQLIQEAKRHLGSSFNAQEYPRADRIRDHFELSFDFSPIPIGEDFKGLPDRQAAHLAQAIEQKMAAQMENAMQDLWQRASKAVGHMAAKLSDPDAKFHKTLVTNVETAAMQLEHLNVTNDKRVRELAEAIKADLSDIDVKKLKDSVPYRSELAAKARAINARFTNV